MHCKHIERHVKKSTCWTISQERWHLKHHKSECHAQQLFSASTMSPVVLTAFSWGEPSLGCLVLDAEANPPFHLRLVLLVADRLRLSTMILVCSQAPHEARPRVQSATNMTFQAAAFSTACLQSCWRYLECGEPGLVYTLLCQGLKQTLWKSSAQPWISRSVSRILLGPRRMQVVLPWGPSRK